MLANPSPLPNQRREKKGHVSAWQLPAQQKGVVFLDRSLTSLPQKTGNVYNAYVTCFPFKEG